MSTDWEDTSRQARGLRRAVCRAADYSEYQVVEVGMPERAKSLPLSIEGHLERALLDCDYLVGVCTSRRDD